MNSVERVGTTIELREPDRVPVDLHNFQLAARASGMPMSQVFRDGELLADAMLTSWREFGHDMILLENGTGCNAEACGVEVHYRDDTAPVAGRPILDSLTKVADLEVPDPYVTFPMSEILKATRILAREIGDQAWICARADQGPMDLVPRPATFALFRRDRYGLGRNLIRHCVAALGRAQGGLGTMRLMTGEASRHAARADVPNRALHPCPGLGRPDR